MKTTIKAIPSIDTAAYEQNRVPLLPDRMMKLPLGSIKAKGWLDHQLQGMKHGMVGRLKELSEYLKDNNGWFGTENSGWEEQPYWLRGFFSLAVQLGDDHMLQEADRWFQAIFNSVQPDGYYGAVCNKKVVGKNGQVLCDIWPHIVMNDALISYYEYFEDLRVIDLIKNFFHFCHMLPETLYLKEFDKDDFGSWLPLIQLSRAGDMLPQIFWVYNITGEDWLLKFAKKTYDKIASPTNEWLDTHVVNFAQRFSYPALFSQLSRQKYEWALSEYFYMQHNSTWGQQPRGIFGADENIRSGKVDPRQGFETCGMVEYARSFYLMGRISGDPVYAARTEDIMLNHFPAASTPDQKGLHYLTASNQPQLDCSTEHDYQNKGVMIAYSPWSFRCCQHNVAMGWPWYSENLWQGTADGGLCAWLYAPCEVKGKVHGGKEVALSVKTDYPFDGGIHISFNKGAEFPLYLRIPDWCTGVELFVNDSYVDTAWEAGKFLVLEDEWRAGDSIQCHFGMEISLKQWPRNGSVSVDYGPFTYSIKIGEQWKKWGGTEEWSNLEVYPTTAWNYGLVVDMDHPEASMVVKKRLSADGQIFTPEGSPLSIVAKAKKIPNWKLEANQTVPELQKGPILSDEPLEEIEMIPLGCARLRMACLPVIGEGYLANPWKKETSTFIAPPPKAEGED